MLRHLPSLQEPPAEALACPRSKPTPAGPGCWEDCVGPTVTGTSLWSSLASLFCSFRQG